MRLKMKRVAMLVGVAVVAVWVGFGINWLLTWLPPQPDPRHITRDNFGFEMFSQERLLGWDTRHDVAGAQNKLNELFPAGTPLNEFIAFEQKINIPPIQTIRLARFGESAFICNISATDNTYKCRHTYAGLGVLRFDNIWHTIAHFDEHKRITYIDAYLDLYGL
jgi:hypothetical protein